MSKPVRFTQGQFFVALRRLDSWFERQRRVLPWRNRPTLYRVWVSEIMLQQTQVATVIPYFERFMARFPDLQTLAKASEDEVLAYWAGLGYYSRARNLYRAAKILLANGFPTDRAGWLEIPGVGEYTAGAILSIAQNQPEAILDGNVERVLARLRRISDKKRLWRYAEAFVKTGFKLGIRPSNLNQALMELGATVCSPKNPQCGSCPFFDSCRACAAGETDAFPSRQARGKRIDVREELHCLVADDGRILVRKRGSDEWRAGLWDLVERKDLPAFFSAKAREKLWKPIGKIETQHVVTRHKILRTTHVWRARKPGVTVQHSPRAGETEFQWMAPDSSETLSPMACGSALRRTLARIREKFPETLQ